jgi:hypothetical protein
LCVLRLWHILRILCILRWLIGIGCPKRAPAAFTESGIIAIGCIT